MVLAVKPPIAVIRFAEVSDPQVSERHMHQCLLRWQTAGLLHLEVGAVPMDLVTLARTIPSALPADTVLAIFDPALAHRFLQLARRLADPPETPEPPLGS